MNTTSAHLSDLLSRLEIISRESKRKKVITGFDGFIDRIKKPVRTRRGEEIEWFQTIKEFSARISEASGKSGQIELVTEKTKPGGNAPILAEILSRCNIDCLCIGAMGYPLIHEIFSGENIPYRIISILQPGKSDAIELTDGKIIFSDLSSFEHYNWNYVRRAAGLEVLKREAEDVHLFAFADWANLPHASDIWEGMLNDVIRSSGRTDYLFLFDICDPTRKTELQLKKLLELISRFSDFGQVTLGLNENETIRIYRQLFGSDASDVYAAAGRLFSNMTIAQLLVHPTDRCLIIRKEGVTELTGHLITEPRVLTGGGDNLNGGFCLGWVNGMPTESCVLLGMAASGAYIRNGYAPGLNDLKAYLKYWSTEINKNNDV